MIDFIFTVMFFVIVGIFAYGFHEWLDKIELEKEYLTNLIQEQNSKKYTLRKDM